MSNLPVIVLTADQWNPGKVTLSKVSRTIKENEMRTICSLTSGLSKKEMEGMSSADREPDPDGDDGAERLIFARQGARC